MHRALLIAELVNMIMGNLCDDDNDIYYADIGALAQTCWAFSGPALDILWHTQPGIANLVKYMPDDLWEESGVTYQNVLPEKSLTFRRAILPGDWTRFHVYARRIRRLKPESSNCTGHDNLYTPVVVLANHVYRALSASRPPSILFPNIRELTACRRACAPSCFDYSIMFLGPSVTKVKLSSSIADSTLNALLGSLPRLCPRLQCLSTDLRFMRVPPKHLPFPPGSFGSLKSLRSFSIICDVPMLWETFAELSSARRLSRLAFSSEQSARPPTSTEPGLLLGRHDRPPQSDGGGSHDADRGFGTSESWRRFGSTRTAESRSRSRLATRLSAPPASRSSVLRDLYVLANLRVLEVRPAEVAAMLSELFPNLRRIVVPENSNYGFAWGDAERHLKANAAAHALPTGEQVGSDADVDSPLAASTLPGRARCASALRAPYEHK
ncbi:uncharacterized protein FIBRA_01200 [Fibroporia radiculosa]|uniref:Uncharacterized protein n=1 Tax=Fibroporia radiculosa TaxID=599839 RepID=J4GJJ8_9APHY|nr:uncharacterized protein FIBRA_01200 [Fibroporia radiculosa]CCL99185.1 predicted protein [Fibroporia radiculosa]